MKKIILLILGLTFSFQCSYAQQEAISVNGDQFADSPGDYLKKTIKLSGVQYLYLSNLGEWDVVTGMTLRSKGDNFEDSYGQINYYNKNKKYYCRTITCSGNKVKLLIPKILSQKMPNTTQSFVIITGKVLSFDTIEVISIVRD